MNGLVITPAALHALLNDAHTALAEHRIDFAGTVLHVLRRVTEPDAAAPQGLARRLLDDLGGTHHAPPNQRAAGGSVAWALTPEAARPAEPCDAEAGTPAPPTCIPGKWTPDRVALLRDHLPNCTDRPALLARINALPGLPIATVKAMMVKAREAGIAVEPWVPRAIETAAGQRGGRVSVENGLATTPSTVRTAERFAAFPALWMDASLSVAQIHARMNAMPGTPLSSSTQLYGWAKKAGLPTQRALPHVPLAEPPDQPEAETAAPTDHIPDTTEMVAPPAAPREPLPSSDPKTEVFDAFDAGQTVRDVAADFGMPLSTLSNWQAEWKLARRKDAP